MSDVRLHWDFDGYFFDPAILQLASGEWKHWLEVFTQAKAGDFSATLDLIDIWATSENRILKRACCLLLGDAGTSQAMATVRARLATGLSYDHPIDTFDALDLCASLATHGDLSNVPAILDVFCWLLAARDSHLIGLYLSSMLESDWGPIVETPREESGLANYRTLVTTRAEELLQQGVSHAYLGEPMHVPNFARQLLARLGSSHFEEAMQPSLRRHFESSTGIDCRHFFANGRFQALTAAATLEAFLASEECGRFAPEQKFFFGHLVPQ